MRAFKYFMCALIAMTCVSYTLAGVFPGYQKLYWLRVVVGGVIALTFINTFKARGEV